MSDFSSLCPLFNTGVYSEITLPGTFSLVSVASTTTKFAGVMFGRSVIVTAAYAAKLTTPASTTGNVKVKLFRGTTFKTAGTAFASLKISKTVTAQPLNKYMTMTLTAKTFSATQWLTVRALKGTAKGGTLRGVIVRYKEK